MWRVITAGAILAGLPACQSSGGPIEVSGYSDEAKLTVDPLLTALEGQSAKFDLGQTTPFFATLKALARKNRKDPDAYYSLKDAWDGSAALVHTDSGVYAVVVIGEIDILEPDDATQSLLLLDPQGRVVDRLSCSISSIRLGSGGRWGEFEFGTRIVHDAEPDGARIIVWYTPQKGCGFPAFRFHEVCHGGETTMYSWDKASWPAGNVPDWATKGLCRVEIRGGKFHVLFPLPPGGRP